MSGITDKIKGRVKEAIGALADNKDLKKDGKLDQRSGKIKQTMERAVDEAKDAVKRGS